MLTYKKLLKRLKKMTPEQLEMTVTIYDANNIEMSMVDGFAVTGEEDDQDVRPEAGEIDEGHPYLIVGLS